MDGIGATVKMMVRRQIRARKIVVNCAKDFVDAVNLTAPCKIQVEEIVNQDFDDINSDLQTKELFSNAKNIRDISSSHQIQCIDEKIVVFSTSRQGYN